MLGHRVQGGAVGIPLLALAEEEAVDALAGREVADDLGALAVEAEAVERPEQVRRVAEPEAVVGERTGHDVGPLVEQQEVPTVGVDGRGEPTLREDETHPPSRRLRLPAPDDGVAVRQGGRDLRAASHPPASQPAPPRPPLGVEGNGDPQGGGVGEREEERGRWRARRRIARPSVARCPPPPTSRRSSTSPSWKVEAATRCGFFGRNSAGRPSTVTVWPTMPIRSTTARPSGLYGRMASATAKGVGVRFVISITASGPSSPGTAYTRCTASPPGMRIDVSTTGVSPTSCWRTADSRDGKCQRSSAPIHQSNDQPSYQGVRRPRGSTMPFRSRAHRADGRPVALGDVRQHREVPPRYERRGSRIELPLQPVGPDPVDAELRRRARADGPEHGAGAHGQQLRGQLHLDVLPEPLEGREVPHGVVGDAEAAHGPPQGPALEAHDAGGTIPCSSDRDCRLISDAITSPARLPS